MKIIKSKKVFNAENEAVTIESLNVQYTERDVDLSEIKKMAIASARRIEKDYEKRLDKAIENNDSYYIRKELRNVSTYDLIKMILRKLI